MPIFFKISLPRFIISWISKKVFFSVWLYLDLFVLEHIQQSLNWYRKKCAIESRVEKTLHFVRLLKFVNRSFSVSVFFFHIIVVFVIIIILNTFYSAKRVQPNRTKCSVLEATSTVSTQVWKLSEFDVYSFRSKNSAETTLSL